MRLAGTFAGAVLGMVCWYIGAHQSGYTKPLFSTNRMCAGAGHGTGNPYGIAVITGAFLLPLVFLRIYAPPQYLVGILMTGVSAFSRTTSKRGC